MFKRINNYLIEKTIWVRYSKKALSVKFTLSASYC